MADLAYASHGAESGSQQRSEEFVGFGEADKGFVDNDRWRLVVHFASAVVLTQEEETAH